VHVRGTPFPWACCVRCWWPRRRSHPTFPGPGSSHLRWMMGACVIFAALCSNMQLLFYCFVHYLEWIYLVSQRAGMARQYAGPPRPVFAAPRVGTSPVATRITQGVAVRTRTSSFTKSLNLIQQLTPCCRCATPNSAQYCACCHWYPVA
jgi:hypothetical protein